MKKIHFLWATSTLLALFPTIAHAQVVAYPSGSLYYYPPQGYSAPYGYNANSGSFQQNNQDQNDDGSNNSDDNDNSQKIPVPSNANVTPGWASLPGYEKDKKTEQDSQSSNDNSKNESQTQPNNTKDNEAEQLKKIEHYRNAQSGNQNTDKKKEDSEKKTDTKTENSEKKDYIVKGKATALDGITLTINGHIFQLKNILAPGNGQQCFTHGMPWDCGDEARNNLQNIVDDQIVTCHVIDKKAICKTDTDGDVIQDVIESGYAIPAKQDGVLHKKENIEAKIFHRGLYQD